MENLLYENKIYLLENEPSGGTSYEECFRTKTRFDMGANALRKWPIDSTDALSSRGWTYVYRDSVKIFEHYLFLGKLSRPVSWRFRLI